MNARNSANLKLRRNALRSKLSRSQKKNPHAKMHPKDVVQVGVMAVVEIPDLVVTSYM